MFLSFTIGIIYRISIWYSFVAGSNEIADESEMIVYFAKSITINQLWLKVMHSLFISSGPLFIFCNLFIFAILFCNLCILSMFCSPLSN